MEYLCGINNYIAQERLGNRLPFEEFRWETPDISMIQFKFWYPVYYRNWTDKAGKVLMHPGRFIGFAWIIGDPMTFRVLQCNDDMHKRHAVVHRSIAVPRSPTATGYNFVLAPKIDSYFTVVQVEGGATSKNVPLEHQGTVDPPDIYIAERRGKRRKPSSSFPKSVELDQPTANSNDAVVDGPSTAGGFPALANIGDVNENGTTNEMDWSAMGQKEVQDQHNYADKFDIFPIDILSC